MNIIGTAINMNTFDVQTKSKPLNSCLNKANVKIGRMVAALMNDASANVIC